MKNIKEYLIENKINLKQLISAVENILGEDVDRFEHWVNLYKVNNVCVYLCKDQIEDLNYTVDEYIKELNLPNTCEIKILNKSDFREKSSKWWSASKEYEDELASVSYSRTYFYYRYDAGIDILFQKINK